MRKLFGLSLLFSSAAAAGPFCVVTGAGTNCSYFEANYCRQVAQSMGGMCVPNSESLPAGQPPVRTYDFGAAFREGRERAQRERMLREEHQANLELTRAQTQSLTSSQSGKGVTIVYECKHGDDSTFRTVDPAVGCVVAEILR